MSRTTILAALLGGAALLPATAFASAIQDDIAACGSVAEEAGVLETGTYSLRFEDDEGNRNRVLTLKALKSDGTDAELIECRMERRKVLEVVSLDAAPSAVSLSAR